MGTCAASLKWCDSDCGLLRDIKYGIFVRVLPADAWRRCPATNERRNELLEKSKRLGEAIVSQEWVRLLSAPDLLNTIEL